MTRPHIVVVGSLNMDFTYHVRRMPEAGETLVGDGFSTFAGGKGANQAVAAARLRARVTMIGQVGGDGHGEYLTRHLAEAGVDTSRVEVDRGVSTGVAIIGVEPDGQNRIVIVPGANGTFGRDRIERHRDVIATADVLLLQLEVPLDTVEAAARIAVSAGVRVILDPAPAQVLSRALLGAADYVTPNEAELGVLVPGLKPRLRGRSRFGAAKARATGDDRTTADGRATADDGDVAERAKDLLAAGARAVLVKEGAAGAALVAADRAMRWPAFRVDAVDTTGAGDAFNAAFAIALAENQGEARAGTFATAAGALCVTRAGAQASMPTREEVEELMIASRA